MSLVCFDTQVVIWSVKGEAKPGQEDMIPKARHLLQKCEDEGIKIVIPSIVIAELLSGLNPERHNDFSRTMQKRFIVPPFDTMAAAYFAKIWRSKKQIRQELTDTKMATRAEMKADSMIVAIAVAHKVSCIYSHDEPLKKFAKGFVDTRELPEAPPVVTQRSFVD